jgi:hypothetical protein
VREFDRRARDVIKKSVDLEVGRRRVMNTAEVEGGRGVESCIRALTTGNRDTGPLGNLARFATTMFSATSGTTAG